MVDQWKPTDPASAAHLNQLAAAVNALLSPGAVGTGQYGSTGTTFDQTKSIELEVFELTEDIKYPAPEDETFPPGWSEPPDVPYAENCKQIWLKGDDNTYVILNQPDETVYFPTDVDFDPGDDPAITAGDRVQATYNTQRSRWEADVPTTAEVPENPTATVIMFLVNQTTVAATGDAFAVDTITVVSPFGGATPTVTSVVNLLHFPSVVGNPGVAFLKSGTWYGIPQPPMETVSAVTSLGYDDTPHEFDASTTDVVVFSKAAESSPVAWHSAELVTHVITVEKDGTALKYNTEDVYTIETGSNPQTTTWETLTTVDPVTDIDYDTSDHEFKLKLTQDVEVFSQNGSGGAWPEDANFDVQSPWHVTTEETVVVSVDKSSLLLRYQTEKTHALEAFDTSANSTWHTLVTVDPVTDVDYTTGTHTFDYKLTQNVEVFARDSQDAAWTEWHPMVTVDPVTDIDYSTSNHDFDLKKTQNVYVVEKDSEDAAWTTWHPAVNETQVVTEFNISDPDVTWKYAATFYVLESIVEDSVNTHEGDECA
jgi:hypothetical protein